MSLNLWDALILGFYLGCAAGWWFNRKPAVIRNAKIETTLVVDPKVLTQINGAMVQAWLEERDLVWQPRGAVFDPERKITK